MKLVLSSELKDRPEQTDFRPDIGIIKTRPPSKDVGGRVGRVKDDLSGLARASDYLTTAD
jgi:hypothetical protein